MSAAEMIGALYIGAILGLVGGVLNGIVDARMARRQWVAGIVGGMVAAGFMAPIEPMSRVDLVLLALCGFLAADVFEALMAGRR